MNQKFLLKMKGLFLTLLSLFYVLNINAQTDVTATYLTNTTFASSNATGWTNKYYDFTPAYSNNVMEYYKGSVSSISSCFALTQQITTLPEGVYRITMNGFSRSLDAVTNVILYGETSGKQYQTNLKTLSSDVAAYGSTPGSRATASTAFYSSAVTGGYWLNTVDNIIVEDGKLIVGLTNNGQLHLAASGTSNNWTCFANFKLYQLTGSALQPLLNTKISEAQTLAAKNYSNVADLNTAISNAQAIAAVDIVYNDIKTLQNAINSYNNSSLGDATSVNPVDISFKITNASFENGAARMTLAQIGGQTGTDYALSGGGGYYAPFGWTTTIAAAAIGNGNTWDGDVVCNNGTVPIAASAVQTPTNGSYLFGSRKRWNSGIINLSQSISGLPGGIYRVSVDLGTAVTTTYTGTFTAKVSGSTLFSATPSTTAFTTFTSSDITLVAGQNLDLSLAMGNNSANTDFRIIMDNIKLTYYGPVTTPTLSAPQTAAAFTVSTNTSLINLTGENLTSDVTITVPSTHITLTGDNVTGTSPNYTIALANSNTTNNITATWDKSANVSGSISFSSGSASKSVSVTSDDVETVAISGINLSAGVLNPVFAVETTTYTVKAPADKSSVTVTATKTPAAAIVTNDGSAVSASSSVVLTGNSYNGSTHTADYTISWNGNYTLADWGANGDQSSTDVSKPSTYGWKCMNTATPPAVEELVWNNFGTQSNCRYRDVNAGYVYGTEDYSAKRVLFIRWDAGGTTNRVFSYPVYLEGCKTYNFTSKAAWNSNGSAPTLTYRINSANDNTGTTYASNTVVTGVSGSLVDANINGITVPTTGAYYVTITANTNSLCAVADLAIAEVTDQSLTLNQTSFVFDELNNTATFKVTGNALGADVALTAPAGVNLSATSVSAVDAQCGVTITATYDNATAINAQEITATSGALSQSILVNASTNATCFSKLYPAGTNLITDSYMNDLANYSGWGSRSLSTSYRYCGAKTAMVTGKCGGSLDFNLTPVIAGSKSYRVKAMVSTNGTGEAKLGISGAQVSLITNAFSTAAAEWNTLDFAFTTQETITSANMYLNSCETQTATQSYIDNLEMYEITTPVITVTEGTVGAFATVRGNTDSKTIHVSGSDIVYNISLALSGTNADMFSVSQTTLTPVSGAVPSTEITVNYTPSVAAADHSATLTISSSAATSQVFTLSGSTTTTGMDNGLVKMIVKAENGKLNVKGVDAYQVFTVQGMKVAEITTNNADTYVTLNAGVYMVKANGQVAKVLVK